MAFWHALAALIVTTALLEHWFAARPRGPASAGRLRTNLAVFGIGTALSLVLAPMGASLMLALADRPAWGGIAAIEPAWLSGLLAFLLLDLTRYFVHRLYHLPGFWRIHAPHHSDAEVDWSTTLRHHPLELVIDLPIYAIVLGLAGVSATQLAGLSLAVLAWEMLAHANLNLPRWADRALGTFAVTPALHLVHHSVDPAEGNRNFGSILSVWDRLFGTFLRPATAPQRLGLATGTPDDQTLPGLLKQPLHSTGNTTAAARP